MTFSVAVDGSRWRAHQDSVVDAIVHASGNIPVPVIKGNGYGLGAGILAREAMRVGADTIAVGTVFEVDNVAADTQGDIVVLEPFTPVDRAASAEWARLGDRLHAGRVIRTIATLDSLKFLVQDSGSVRVILEANTSMHRFGFRESELLAALADGDVREAMERGRVLVEGLAVHMPIDQPADDAPPRGVGEGSAKAREVVRWAGLWQTETEVWEGHNAPINTIWVSHLDDTELSVVRSSVKESVIRLRTGTRLWLGDRGALTATGTVLAFHPVASGTHVGYRQRTGPKGGTLVVVSGGTAHGIGLAGPSPVTSIRQRITAAGIGALDAAGRAMSPFSWQGKQRWFAEPPHQHVSMLWLPHPCVIPEVGDQMTAEVRFTTSRFDEVQGLDD